MEESFGFNHPLGGDRTMEKRTGYVDTVRVEDEDFLVGLFERKILIGSHLTNIHIFITWLTCY